MKVSELINSQSPFNNDLFLILEKISGKNKEFLLAHPNTLLTDIQINNFNNLKAKLNSGEPLSYIIGERYFYESKFKVDSHNLIPRNETEILVDLAFSEVKKIQSKNIKILEVGAGTGCISISLLKKISEELPEKNIKLDAIDINKNSIKLSKFNAKQILTLPQQKHIKFRTLSTPEIMRGSEYDIILSNPPYIPTKDYLELDPSVLNFEPRQALDGGEKGLDVYKEIMNSVKTNSKKSVTLLFEIYETEEFISGLKEMTREILPGSSIQIIKDLTGRNRFCSIQFTPDF